MILLLLLLPGLTYGQATAPNTRGAPVTVQTSRGAVTGFHFDQGSDRSQLFYGAADVFLGIPFAQPPVGPLRWRLPRPVCSYGSGIDATAFKPGCPQSDGPMGGSPRGDGPPSGGPAGGRPPMMAPGNYSEDCLYLNIFSPGVSVGQPAPVMVWIHGGGFVGGSTSMYAPPGIVRNFVSRGVVVVSITYRLGMLGLFTTYTEDFPANRALFDQIMALRWVQEEIVHFGGHPSKVTIWGESAGSISVSALSLSPLARGLFSQTIQQSGGIMQEWTTADTTEKSALRAGQLCGTYTVTQANLVQLVNCLNSTRWQDMTRLDGTSRAIGEWQLSQDGVLFPDSPSRLAAQRPNRPAILGTNRDEFALFFGVGVSSPDRGNSPANLSMYNSSFLIPYLLAQRPSLTPYASVIQQILTRQYAPGDTYAPGNELVAFKASVQAMSDAMFVQNTRQDANWHLENGNPDVFLYRYDYVRNICMGQTFQGYAPVGHGQELCYMFMDDNLFRQMQSQGQLTQEDVSFIDYIASTWTNFVVHGRPSSDWGPVSSRTAMEFNKLNTTHSMADHFQQISDSIFNVAMASIAGEYPRETIKNRDWIQWINQRYAPAVTAEWNRYGRQVHKDHALETMRNLQVPINLRMRL